MNNGRVNIMGPNTGDIFKLYEQVPLDNKSTSYKIAMAGNWQSTVLSDAFFSGENIRIIQNAIKASVYHMSKTSFVIGTVRYRTVVCCKVLHCSGLDSTGQYWTALHWTLL